MATASSKASTPLKHQRLIDLSDEKRSALHAAYQSASTIVEFGGGQSTEMAAGLAQKKIITVEHDRNFALLLARHLKPEALQSIPLLDVIETHKADDIANYTMSPWTVRGAPNPDVIFLNSPFSAACFATLCLMAKTPVRVFYNNYANDPLRAAIAKFSEPKALVDGMAEFEISPTNLSELDIALLLKCLTHQATPNGSENKESADWVTELSVDCPSILVDLDDIGTEAYRLGLHRKFRKALDRLLTQKPAFAAASILVQSPYLFGLSLFDTVQRKAHRLKRHAYPKRKTPIAPSTLGEGSKEAAQRKDDFVLYRIIGNDLEPRHSDGQSIQNVKFILENEPEFKDCRKKWVLNRIFDPVIEQQIIALLESFEQDYTRIPFDFEDYAAVPFDVSLMPSPDYLQSPKFEYLDPDSRIRAVVQSYRKKNNYVMHNNGARNFALRAGKQEAKWVLPWDGNCFLTAEAWQELREAVIRNRHLQYFSVPMARFGSNADLMAQTSRPEAKEEPQLLFRYDSAEEFDAEHPYGRRPKVELLARLGIPGPWDVGHLDPWDLPLSLGRPEPDMVGEAGWVARLASGKAHLETAQKATSRNRMNARNFSIIATIDKLDKEVLRRRAPWYRAACDGQETS